MSKANPAQALLQLITDAIERENAARSDVEKKQKKADFDAGGRRAQIVASYRTVDVWATQEPDDGFARPAHSVYSGAIENLGRVMILVSEVQRSLEEVDSDSVRLLDLRATFRAIREMVGSEGEKLTAQWAFDVSRSSWKQLRTIWEYQDDQRGPILDRLTLQSLRMCAQLLRNQRVLGDLETQEVYKLRAEGREIREEVRSDDGITAKAREFIVSSVEEVDEALARAETEGLETAKDVANNAVNKVLSDPELGEEVTRSQIAKKGISWLSKTARFGFDTAVNAAIKAAVDPWVQHAIGQLTIGHGH